MKPYNDDFGHEVGDNALPCLARVERECSPQHDASMLRQITASLGVASLTEETRTLDELMETANQQTYRAKRAGKNRVSVVYDTARSKRFAVPYLSPLRHALWGRISFAALPANRGGTLNMKALVIVGHGSHLNEDSSLPVYEHAARIRERFSGEFDEVVECFWKEEPSMRHVLDTVEAQEVYVVPAFISEGYFTQQVIPRELGLSGPVTRKGDKTVRYAGPLGTYQGMADVILERAEDLLRDKEIPPGRRALVLLGHGTDLNKSSGGVIYLNAERIRERGLYDLVEVGFLDQAPEIGEVVENVEAENVVLIPVFIAEGWHTRETIPEDLGLTGAVTARPDKTIFYGAPVGTHPSMAALIAARARETERAEHEVARGVS